MEGTDRLENLFCDCRTQDHSQNFDIEQLGQKLSVATLIDAAFERNPDIDRSHRKLNLQGAIGIDCINPKSWEGDTCVGNVNIQKEWNSGREKVLVIMGEYLGAEYAPDLIWHFSQPNRDILRPTGDYVGVAATADDARSEEEAPTPIASEDEVTMDPTTIPQNPGAAEETHESDIVNDVLTEPLTFLPKRDSDKESNASETFQNLETIVAFASEIDGHNREPAFENRDELDDARIELDDYFPEMQDRLGEDREPEIFSHVLKEGDKHYLKSGLVANLRPAQWKRIPVRPFQVQVKTLESIYQNTTSNVKVESSPDANELASKDLVTFLVLSGNQFCLMVLEVLGFHFKNEKTLKLRMGINHITNGQGEYRVSRQVIELSQNSDNVGLWDWTK